MEIFPMMPAIKVGGHCCEGHLPECSYGEAITDCVECVDGSLWAGNTEYGSQVNFCPYCGFEAKTQALTSQK